LFGADEADLAPRIMAQVVAVNVREGDLVRARQVLATLDDRESQDALMEAGAAQTAANAAYLAQHDATARDRRLFGVKAISQEQWDRSVAADAAAAAQREEAARRLDSARTRLSYCQVLAPAAGVVARRLADPGDLAVPGKPLFKFVRQETVRVRAELPPEDWTELRIGLPVTLTLGDTRIEAAVSRVFPAMGENQLAAFEADVPHPPAGFVSGAAVGVDVQLGAADGLAVPADALLESDKGAFVFAVSNDLISVVKVDVLDRSLNKVAVRGDLRAGEQVVVAEPSRLMTLTGGMKIIVAAGQ
jgi:RND family efflux transporter MFP subunit